MSTGAGGQGPGCTNAYERAARTDSSVVRDDASGINMDVVALFKRLASDETDPFRRHKQEMMRVFASRLRAHPRPTVVDIGCGAGLDLELLRPELDDGAQLVGVDKMGAALAAGRELHPLIRFIEADALHLPIEPGSADGACASRLLFHVAQLDAALDSIVRVLRPGGAGLLCEGDTRAMQVLCASDAVGRAAAARAAAMEKAVANPHAAVCAYEALLRRSDVTDVSLRASTIIAFDSHRPVGTDAMILASDQQFIAASVQRGALAQPDADAYLAAMRREEGAPSLVQLATLFEVSFTKTDDGLRAS